MTEIPDVQYAKSGDVSIAYQVIGSGPTDVVFVRGFTGDLLSAWDEPLLVRHLEGLASNGRLLVLDKRGTGLSDRVWGCRRSRHAWTTFAPSWMRKDRSRPCSGAAKREPT